jgi:chromosome segregation ATPase
VTRTENQKIETLQTEIATLQQSLLAQTKLTQEAEILKNSLDYEFEEFKKRLKNREVELTITLERERDLNATFTEKIRNAESRAMDADAAKEKLHQMMRAEALESAEQIARLSTEVEVMVHRIQTLEKELGDTEADRGKVAAIDAVIKNLNYTRRTKHSETKLAINALIAIIRPGEGEQQPSSLDDSVSLDTSLIVDDQLAAKVATLEQSLADQKAKIEALSDEKRSLHEQCSNLQLEYDNLSMQAMEQIEEADKLQKIITAVEKCFADDSTGTEVALEQRVAKRLEELNAKIAALEVAAKKPEPTVEEKELQTSIVEDGQLQELVKTNEDLNVAVRRMGQEINTLNEQQSTVDGVAKELADLKVDHATLQTKHDQTASHLEGIKSTITWLEQEKAQLELVVEQYKREAAEAVEEISSLKSSLKDLERSEIGNESGTLATEELTHQLEEVRATLAAVESAKAEGERTIGELQTKLASEAATFEQLKALNEQTIQELEEKIGTMELEFGEKVGTLQTTIKDQEDTLAQKDQATLALSARVTDLENNMNKFEATQREDFAERCGQLTAEMETLKSSNRDYCNLIGELEGEKQILADTMSKEVQRYEEKLKR